ncbi:polysaccharide lyase family 1 protein [Streptomyces sp. NPDC050418]|uniref:polysaccharide lyase family 1 protein n=1 Tax=Streptomyces sp. NPDC050418 TaxID=3365612 RepID=UPI003799CA42
MTHHHPARRKAVAALAACTLLALLATPAAAHAKPAPKDPARQTLGADDGWASEGPGTTGGAAAGAERVYTVSTWAQFRTVLEESGDAPKIIKVRGVLDATAAGCAAFEADGYRFDQYLADYDPAVWGHDRPVSGPQEDLRAASAARQAEAITVQVPANTTIIGEGRNAAVNGASLQIKDVDNVIVRNLTFEAPLDCFPQWDPTDGATGAWNSEYDAVVVYGSTHVWLDHNTFGDGRYPDATLPSYYGEIYQQHDGLLDIVRGANHVTASWNVFRDHDKTLMIGNSDSAGSTDAGKLKVTLHHNRFESIVERAPRVRFGQVDTYNNHYVVTEDQPYVYALGIGQDSQLVAEKNAFTLPPSVSAGRILKKWKDAPVTAEGNLVNGARTDLIAVHNAEFPEEALREGAGWTPALRARVDSARAVPVLVGKGAGAGKLC